MSKTLAGVLAVLMVTWSTAAAAQQADPDMQKVIEQYQERFNKGDARALSELYATEAVRLGADGQLLTGRDAIQKSFEAAWAGPLKGARLTLRPGRTVNVSADVRIMEGLAEVTGMEGGPMRSRYVNTVARQGGQWRLASVVVVPQAGGQ